jgi:hypothetical protein
MKRTHFKQEELQVTLVSSFVDIILIMSFSFDSTNTINYISSMHEVNLEFL